MSRNKKNNVTIKNKKMEKTLILAGIVLIIIFFVSVIFSLINIGNTRIIGKVKIGNIDVSNLTKEEATTKIEDWYKNTALKDITVKYQNLEDSISMEQIEPIVEIDKKVMEACLIGRKSNIIVNNYEILYSMIFSKNLQNEISLNEEAINKKISELNSKLPNTMEESNYYVEDEKLIITKGKPGIQVDKEEFKKQLQQTILGETKEFTIPVNEIKPTEINIEEIYKEIYREEKNASIEKNPVKVIPEVVGVDLKISLEEAKKILQEDKEEYIIPLLITVPEITLNKLGQEAFPETLGKFSTTYSLGNENRETNLKLASEKVNGTIVLPGETFSYNKTVGERTISKGYKEAAVYAGGKVVNGIGGGICQLSSTLYNAVIYANLDITYRTNHRFLTSYVTAGRDATVSWGTIDFSFKNTRKYPIKVESDVKNGVVTVKILGIKEEKEYDIEIESKITEVIPYTTNYVKDSDLDEGIEEIKQNGANGAKSTTYKITRENGVIISRTLLSSDTYSPLEKIVKKGTKKIQEVNSNITEDTTKSSIENELNPELLETIKEL